MSAQAARSITLVIPVADRPRQLAACLHSLQSLLHRYPYAGDLAVLIAEDSASAENIEQHRQLATTLHTQGLHADYFGIEDQQALLARLDGALRIRLAGVLGDGRRWAHKGASITRNLAYLWLAYAHRHEADRLIWFIDSDQLFCVNRIEGQDEIEDYAIDYLSAFDALFARQDIDMLTGKVVGDPPVSPAVMAGNFLDDVIGFVHEILAQDKSAPCAFHAAPRHADDAAYHDMAELFGFAKKTEFRYRCTLSGAHTNADCLAEFSRRLPRFFDGEHPTRRSYYQPLALADSLTPARTVYTGNYAFTLQAGLDYFIPFAPLRLRMAGPTLGRIIKAERGARFASANLPMLHQRTASETGQAECRPGVAHQADSVDLTDEFLRQYYGDVMLFSVERLAAQGELNPLPEAARLAALIDEIDAQIYARYAHMHALINKKITYLEGQLAAAPSLLGGLQIALNGLRNNFADQSAAWRSLADSAQRVRQKHLIVEALRAWPDERAAWRIALQQLRNAA